MRQRRSQGGFSLVELMVASVIGLLIAAALTAIFVANSRSRTEIDQSHMQIENGRYALELLSEEIRLAGFYANLPMGAQTRCLPRRVQSRSRRSAGALRPRRCRCRLPCRCLRLPSAA